MAASAEALLAARRGGRLASADGFLAAYEDAAPDERRAFLADLAWRFEPDRRRLDKAVERYKAVGNGAKVFQVHPGANPSERGLRESFGAMVNYFYDPRLLDANQALVAAGKRIPASGIVAALASGNDRKAKPPVE